MTKLGENMGRAATGAAVLVLAGVMLLLSMAEQSVEHNGGQNELMLTGRTAFGMTDKAPNAYSRPGGGAYFYSPEMVRAQPAGAVIISGGKHHMIGEMIPVDDLTRLETVDEKDRDAVVKLRKGVRDLEEEDKSTLRRVGKQLGALRRKMEQLINKNVLLRCVGCEESGRMLTEKLTTLLLRARPLPSFIHPSPSLFTYSLSHVLCLYSSCFSFPQCVHEIKSTLISSFLFLVRCMNMVTDTSVWIRYAEDEASTETAGG